MLKSLIEQIPLPLLVLLTFTLGLAPFTPEPHIVEKSRMLINGSLKRPIDIFDLVFHALPLFLLLAKLIIKIRAGRRDSI